MPGPGDAKDAGQKVDRGALWPHFVCRLHERPAAGKDGGRTVTLWRARA